MVRGRLWRHANPRLSEPERQALVDALMHARRAVRAALRSADADRNPGALPAARRAVDAAKHGLGERGPVWWTDGEPDYNRRLARNTPYAGWAQHQEDRLTPRPGFTTQKLGFDDMVLATLALPSGPLRITHGLGSGLARRAGDASGRFWALGDRGPNLKVKVAVKRYGVEALRPLRKVDGAKIMPALENGPELVELALEGDRIRFVRTLPLLGRDGVKLTGLPVPAGDAAECEPIFSLAGDPLGTDPSGVDSEGVAVSSDGSFWIGDEYGPSLLRVDPDGRVAVRWVPAGTEHHYAGAAYPVEGILPALAAARRLNRGFEALALSSNEASPDEALLTLAFQSPLAHPDRAAHKGSRHVRIWRLDAATGALAAEFVYPLDPPENFRRDVALGDFEPSDVKVSEILTLPAAYPDGPDRLLILERGSASTRFYAVDLDPARAAPPSTIDPATRPTLEQMDEAALAAAGIVPLAKTLIFDTDDAPAIPADLEGAILLSPRELLLVNDSDFGVEGADTHFWRVAFDRDIA